MFPAPHFPPGQTGSGAWTTRLGPVNWRGGAPGRARLPRAQPPVCQVASTHSWMSQSPAARAALLWAWRLRCNAESPTWSRGWRARRGAQGRQGGGGAERERLRAWGARVRPRLRPAGERGSVGRQTEQAVWSGLRARGPEEQTGVSGSLEPAGGTIHGTIFWETVWHFLKKLKYTLNMIPGYLSK